MLRFFRATCLPSLAFGTSFAAFVLSVAAVGGHYPQNRLEQFFFIPVGLLAAGIFAPVWWARVASSARPTAARGMWAGGVGGIVIGAVTGSVVIATDILRSHLSGPIQTALTILLWGMMWYMITWACFGFGLLVGRALIELHLVWGRPRPTQAADANRSH